MAANVQVVVTGVDRASDVLKRVASNLGTVAIAAGGVAVAAGAAFLADAVKSTMEFAGQVDDLNDKLGIGAEAASAWAVALKLGETDVESGTKAIQALSRDIAEGGEKLRAFGVSAKTAGGENRDFNAIMGDVADRFASMPDGLEKTGLAMDLFGKSGASMIPILNKGRDGLGELLGAANKYGLALSDDTVAAQDAVNLSLAKLGFAFQGIQVAIGSEFLPVIAEMVDGLSEFAASVIPWVSDTAAAFTQFFEAVGPDIQAWTDQLGGIGPVLQGVSRFIADFMTGLDFAFRAGGVLIKFFSDTFDGMTKAMVAGVMTMVVHVQSLADIVGLGLAGQFDKIGPRVEKTADQLKILNQISRDALTQTSQAATGLGGALAGAAQDAFNDTEAFRNLGAVGAAAFDTADASLKKYQASLTQASTALKEHGDKLAALEAKEEEINDKRGESNRRVAADLERTYEDAVRSMKRRQEDWALEEVKLRETATEKANGLLADYTAKNKTANDRIKEINQELTRTINLNRAAELEAERKKLQDEIAANTNTYNQKIATLNKEMQEKFAAMDREKARAVEDHNLAVTRARDRAQYQIDTTNAATDNEIAAIEKKKVIEVAAVDAAKAKYDELKGKINEVTDALNNAATAAQNAANAMGSANLGTSAGPVPAFATGGYTGGYGGPAILHPDEFIIPGDRMRAGMGGGINYDQLAAALARQPVIVTMDGERVAAITRERLAYGQARGRTTYNVSGS